MDRRVHVAVVLCGAAVAIAGAAAHEARRIELHLRGLDLRAREARIELVGLERIPSANFFTFSDVRDRHFVAMSVHCDPPKPPNPELHARSCRLEIPAGYERHPLQSLVLHLRGLNGRAVSVPLDEIDAAQRPPAATENLDGGVDSPGGR